MKTFIDEKDYWVSSSGFLGRSFAFQTLDLELEESLEFLFDNFLKSLSQNVRIKISLFQELSHHTSLETERKKAIEEKGFLTITGLIHFEHKSNISVGEAFKKAVLKKDNFLRKRFIEIRESLDTIFLNKLKAKPVSALLFKDLYKLHKPVSIMVLGLKSRKNLLGILKLKNSGNHPLSLKTLPLILKSVPKPFGFHISLEKMSHARGEKTLKAKSREEAEGKGQVSYEKYRDTERAISEVELSGEELFNFEVHLTLTRRSEEVLRKDMALASNSLSPLGEWSLESFGAHSSLLALSPGDKLHYKLIEKSSSLKCLFPCLRLGASPSDRKGARGGLLYHRQDNSLDVFNPFSPKYSNHTGVIIGKSGKGKSVFASLLTKSLYYDDKVHIFLVDVKGSHKKTIKELGGKTYNIDIKNSSGLNPLKNLTESKESIEIASSFLEKLFLEEEEISLPSEEKTLLEKNLIQFSKKIKSDIDKTLDNFYKTLKHPRKNKLSRWIKGSLNENIFKSANNISNERLLYFNFEHISTASNSLIAKAIIASIMSEFSFKLLTKEPQEKFIFISDETPFFIKNCFNTFSLLSKNVRKLNGSLILIAQNSKDLIFNRDSSLIDNSEFKILFSYDGEEKKFKELFSLTDSEFQRLKHIRTIKGEFSQFLLKDSIGLRSGFLRLSKKEYIMSNTEPEFLHKVLGIQKLLNINEEKALKVMSYV